MSMRQRTNPRPKLPPWLRIAFATVLGTAFTVVLLVAHVNTNKYSIGERVITGLLITVFVTLSQLSSKTSELENHAQSLTKLDELTGNMEFYPDFAVFYNAIKSEVRAGCKEVRVTYMRNYPPESYQDEKANAYFDDLLDWSKGIGHSLCRAICKPDGDLRSWAESQLALTKSNLNYHVKVVDIEPTSVNAALNIAVLDKRIVFVGFAMPNPNEIKGFSIKNTEAANYFREYFERMWTGTTTRDLSTYLASTRAANI